MKGDTLEVVNHHPILGVELNDSLLLNNHIYTTIHFFFWKSLFGFLKKEKILSIKSERKSSNWFSLTKSTISIKHLEPKRNKWKQVQRHDARRATNQPYNSASVSKMTIKLEWPRFKHRWSDVNNIYKVVNCASKLSFFHRRSLVYLKNSQHTKSGYSGIFRIYNQDRK